MVHQFRIENAKAMDIRGWFSPINILKSSKSENCSCVDFSLCIPMWPQGFVFSANMFMFWCMYIWYLYLYECTCVFVCLYLWICVLGLCICVCAFLWLYKLKPGIIMKSTSLHCKCQVSAFNIRQSSLIMRNAFSFKKMLCFVLSVFGMCICVSWIYVFSFNMCLVYSGYDSSLRLEFTFFSLPFWLLCTFVCVE